MESKIIITPEIIEKANDYVPLLEKQKLAEEVAQKCVVKVQMSYVPTGANKSEPLPDRYQELRSLTSVYLMGILAHEYLRMPYDGDDSLQMPANVYDRWAGSHVMNQLERMKSDKSISEKVYNLLYDYKELRWLVGHEIEVILGHNNDVVWRLMDAMNAAASQALLGGLTSEASGNGDPADKLAASADNARRELEAGIEKLSEIKNDLERRKAKLMEERPHA